MRTRLAATAIGAVLVAGCPTPAERGDGAGTSSAAGGGGAAGGGAGTAGAGTAGEGGSGGAPVVPKPAVAWSVQLGTTEDEAAAEIAPLASGNALALGTFTGSLSAGDATLTGGGAYLVELDGATGAPLTGGSFRGASFTNVFRMTIDGLGNAWVAGHLSGAISVSDKAASLVLPSTPKTVSAFVARRGPNGKIDRFLTFPAAPLTSTATSVAVANGSLYVGGSFGGQITLPAGVTLTSKGGDDAFVFRLAVASGELLWARRLGGAGSDGLPRLTVQDGVVHAFGQCGAEISVDDGPSQACAGFFHATFDDAGKPLGLTTFAVAEPSFPDVGAGGTDTWVGGQFRGMLTLGDKTYSASQNSDVFAARIDPSGKVVASGAFGDGGPQLLRSLTPSPTGVVLCGATRSTIPTPLGPLKATGNDSNAFLLGLGTSAEVAWGVVFQSDGGNMGQSCDGVSTAADGTHLAAVTLRGKAFFGETMRESAGLADAVFLKLVPP